MEFTCSSAGYILNIIGQIVFNMQKIKIEQHGAAGLWFAGWLFTIGFLHLTFWKGVLAIVIWPYYIGDAVAALSGVIQ
jgi:hypothetical protein